MHFTRDAHVHTEFCPHGDRSPTESFVQQALRSGLTAMSFTEHLPLPTNAPIPHHLADAAMSADQLPSYWTKVNDLKRQYNGQLQIARGFEVDFLEGFEDYTRTILAAYPPDDAILSVHFLPGVGGLRALDLDVQELQEGLLGHYGDLVSLHRAYWQTVLTALQTDLGPHGPRRFGHLTLLSKFRKAFPPPQDAALEHVISQVLDCVRDLGFDLDLNSAGLRKPLCGEIYPNASILAQACKRGIAVQFGSDAHAPLDVAADLAGCESALAEAARS